MDLCKNASSSSMQAPTQLTFICSNSTIETLEKSVKYVQSQQ